MKKIVTITWRAFSTSPYRQERGPHPVATKTIEVETDKNDLELCEDFFAQTNLYSGPLWDALQPLPEPRSHTALSVIFRTGDYVTIDGRTYEVKSMGFEEVK